MIYEERKIWMASLKPGDQVIVSHPSIGDHLDTIQTITPTHRFILTKFGHFWRSGYEVKRDSTNRYQMEPVTPERLEEMQRKERLEEMQRKNLTSAVNSELTKLTIAVIDNLSTDLLEELLEVLKRAKEEKVSELDES